MVARVTGWDYMIHLQRKDRNYVRDLTEDKSAIENYKH
jgi:hypothetical protein